MTYYIGIDPGGSSGCIAVYIPESNKVETLRFARSTHKEISDFMVLYEYDSCAVIEKVSSMPKQGVSSMFKFGENFGLLQGMIWAHQIPFRLELPTTWMKHFSLKKGKDEGDTAWKRRIKQQVEMKFPDRKVTNDEADAIMIALYNYETTK